MPSPVIVAELVVGVRDGVGEVEEERRPPCRSTKSSARSVNRSLENDLSLVEPVVREEDLVLVVPEVLGVGVVGVQLVEVAEELVEAPRVRDAAGARPAQAPLAEQRRCGSRRFLSSAGHGGFALGEAALRLARCRARWRGRCACRS